MGIDSDFAMAFVKSQLGSGQVLPMHGTVFISVKDSDKDRVVAPVRELEGMGFKIIATGGTKRHLEANGIACEAINKVLEGRPHIVDAMKNGDVALVFNTTEGAKALADSKDIRRTALLHHIPVLYNRSRCGGGHQGHSSPESGHIARGPFAKLREPPILIHRDRPSVRTARSISHVGSNECRWSWQPCQAYGRC